MRYWLDMLLLRCSRSPWVLPATQHLPYCPFYAVPAAQLSSALRRHAIEIYLRRRFATLNGEHTNRPLSLSPRRFVVLLSSCARFLVVASVFAVWISALSSSFLKDSFWGIDGDRGKIEERHVECSCRAEPQRRALLHLYACLVSFSPFTELIQGVAARANSFGLFRIVSPLPDSAGRI